MVLGTIIVFSPLILESCLCPNLLQESMIWIGCFQNDVEKYTKICIIKFQKVHLTTSNYGRKMLMCFVAVAALDFVKFIWQEWNILQPEIWNSLILLIQNIKVFHSSSLFFFPHTEYFKQLDVCSNIRNTQIFTKLSNCTFSIFAQIFLSFFFP